MKKNKPFWELKLNSHTMLVANRMSTALTEEQKKTNRIEKRKNELAS